MKVLFVIQKLAGLRGGAERVTIETARGLAARGHDVTIACFEPGRGAPAYDTGPVRIVNLFPGGGRPVAAAAPGTALPRRRRLEHLIKALPNGLGLGHLKWALTHGFFARRLSAAIRNEPPDVVVAAMRPAITAAAFAAQASGVPVIAVLHNVPAADYDDRTRWDQNPVYRRRSLAALGLCDSILVLLEEFRDWFPPDIRDRVEVMPNPVARLSPPYADRQRKPLVLAVGRLTTVKRLDLLVAAWGRIGGRHPGWRVEICGTGPEEPALRAAIAALDPGSHITLLGDCPDMGQIYDRAAILCHPAAHEGFGLAVAEALAHGVPAIGFADCPGVNSLIRDGENGLLVPPSDDRAGALAAALGTLVADDSARTRLAAAAPASIGAYAPDRISARWDELLARVTNRHGS